MSKDKQQITSNGVLPFRPIPFRPMG